MVVLDAHWFDRTFSSRSQAETVLRPYLEAGTINDHDYNLAVSFLPGNHRYWPMLYSVGATVLVAAYGRLYKTPRWTAGRTVGICSAANVFGFLYGQVQRASAHKHFVKSLDSREGFLNALRDIAGEHHPQLPRERTAIYPLSQHDHGNAVPAPSSEDAIESTWSTDPNASQSSPSAAPALHPPPASIADHPQVVSRWDEIRTANARGGKSSTWDTLRQGHERQQATDHLQSTQAPTGLNDADAERAREQERFDAMLEAERKAAGR